jgi:hypothetical protein
MTRLDVRRGYPGLAVYLRAVDSALGGALLPLVAAVVVIVLVEPGAFFGTRLLGSDSVGILYPWYVTALKTFWANPVGVYDPYVLGGMPSFNFVSNYDPIYAIPLILGFVPDLGQAQLLELAHLFLIPFALLWLGVLRKASRPTLWVIAALSVAAAYMGPSVKYSGDTDGTDCYAWSFVALAAFEYFRERGRLAYAIVTALCIVFAFVRFATAANLWLLVVIALLVLHWKQIASHRNGLRNLGIAALVGVVAVLPNLIMQGKLYTIIQETVDLTVLREAIPSDILALFGMRLEDTSFVPLHTMFVIPGVVLLSMFGTLRTMPRRAVIVYGCLLGVLFLYALGDVTPFVDLFRAIYRPAALFRRPYTSLLIALPVMFTMIVSYGVRRTLDPRALKIGAMVVVGLAMIAAIAVYPPGWIIDVVVAGGTAAVILVPTSAWVFIVVLAAQWTLLIGFPASQSIFYPQPRNTAFEHFRPYASLNAFLPPARASAAQAFRVVSIGLPADAGMYASVFRYYTVGPSLGTRVPRRLIQRTGILQPGVAEIGPFFLANPQVAASPGMRGMSVRYYFINANMFPALVDLLIRTHPGLRRVPLDSYWTVLEDPRYDPFIASYAEDSGVAHSVDGHLGWNDVRFTVPAGSDHVDLALLYDSWWSARTGAGTQVTLEDDNGQLRVDTVRSWGQTVTLRYGNPWLTASIVIALGVYAVLLSWLLWSLGAALLRRKGQRRIPSESAVEGLG